MQGKCGGWIYTVGTALAKEVSNMSPIACQLTDHF